MLNIDNKKPISKVWLGDCMTFMNEIQDGFFDLVIADPPYGSIDKKIERCGGSDAARYGNKINGWDFAPSAAFFDELQRVGKKVIIWGGNYFNLPPCRCFLVWRKIGFSEIFSFSMCEYAWTNIDDNAMLFSYLPQGTKDDPRFHVTQKPVALYEWILRLYAKDGDKIFDPMMGSQSSRIAAYNYGFDYWGCEIDKEYFDKGCERFDRLCNGIIKVKNQTIKQLKLF